jgi:3-phosphoshikimate 1-carboxyvinyltransferase
VPGDKSIAHRALILGALAQGEQRISGMPPSEDVASSARCLRALGCRIENGSGGVLRVSGRPWKTGERLDAGNSGTTARLLSGLVAGLGLDCTLDGDGSLRRRPMARVVDPLVRMGAVIETAPEGRLPMRIRANGLRGIRYRMPVASAQVKSAILIAGLHADGTTSVFEAAPTRDHTELLLAAMGLPVTRMESSVTVAGGGTLRGIELEVPGDFSSATFLLAAATLVPGSEVRLTGVGVNPTRTGALEILRQMGADIERIERAPQGGEPIADLIVRPAALEATQIGGAIIPALIDELPVLAVVATQAEGTTTVRDAAELRHKESDRIATTVANLRRMGAAIEELPDGFSVHGPCRLKGAVVPSHGDHRAAMAAAVAGLIADGETEIEESEAVAVSYPGFFSDLLGLVNAAGT